MTYVNLRPDNVRVVEVLADDGRWYRGELQGYRRVDGVWWGDVMWTRDVGIRYVGWFPEDRLRRVGSAPDA
jgi:hypothetical protein